MKFKLVSDFKMSQDQSNAVNQLLNGYNNDEKNQTLLGITGSGKTFAIANLIQELNLPTLVMAPNKILSAQLYEEFKEFFPENAVEYFVSYYDYYRPEAYIPQKGVYIEKESSVNEIIDQLRHKATRSLIERRDTIIVASVSCIYGIGSYEAYRDISFQIKIDEQINSAQLVKKLVTLGYEHSQDISRGKILVRGQSIWIGPSHISENVWRINLEYGVVVGISEIDPITRKIYMEYSQITIFPNSHHIIPEQSLGHAIQGIEKELKEYLPDLLRQKKYAEHDRLKEKVEYDLMQLKTSQRCAGIENYSRFFTNREIGQHPPTLFEYFPKPFLLVVDESHISVPQIRGMAAGDAARKSTLVEYGFRLPSCRDNRPMNFSEWDKMRPNTIFVSATPGEFEKNNSKIIEQIIRPTGLLDPVCVVRPTANQIDDAISEIKPVIEKNNRVLMLTLTKKTAENLSEFLLNKGFKVSYMHGDLTPLERVQKLYDFRKGDIDIIVGVNLLREGIDVPECALICIFEADCAGFLRTQDALIQMIGRAARNKDGKVILYADRITPAMKEALEITEKRRNIQIEYNKKHNITPTTIIKKFNKTFDNFLEAKEKNLKPEWLTLKDKERAKLIKNLNVQMKECVAAMKFEEAAKLRDQRNALMELELELNNF